MNYPLVSVIMPVYNGEKTIELALNSLLKQTYINWECIIINDGSNDNTRLILESYTDSRFKIVHLEKNQGRGNARNVGLHHVKGKYITYLDADDFLDTSKLSIQVNLLESDKDIALVASGMIKFSNDMIPYLESNCTPVERALFTDGHPLRINMPTAMIRSELLQSIEYNVKLDVGEDIDFFSRYLNEKYYCNTADFLYYYRIDNLSLGKILHYTKEDIRRGYYLMRRKPNKGLEVIISDILKYCVYLCGGLVLGSRFFLNRRGVVISDKNKKNFISQLQMIIGISK